MITFVTFHIDCTPKAAEHIAQENVWLKNRQQYLIQIELLFRSVAVFHPNSRRVIVTDLSTDLSILPPEIEVVRMDLNPETVMLSRSLAQIDFAKQWKGDCDLIWLDSDMLVNADLTAVFDGSFDVGVTYRTDHEMPINAGILFFAKTHPQNVLNFLEEIYRLYQEKYAEHSTWWGDQYALIDAVGSENLIPGRSDRPQLANGITIALLPCALYNFSPENQYRAIGTRLSPQSVIHFKGGRKRLILPYWQTYLAPLEQPRLTSLAVIYRDRLHLWMEIARETARTKLEPIRSRFRASKPTTVGS